MLGKHNITLVLTDSENNTSTYTFNVTVVNPPPTPPSPPPTTPPTIPPTIPPNTPPTEPPSPPPNPPSTPPPPAMPPSAPLPSSHIKVINPPAFSKPLAPYIMIRSGSTLNYTLPDIIDLDNDTATL